MNNEIFNHTQLTSFGIAIIWQLVSTSSMGHNQAVVQENECM